MVLMRSLGGGGRFLVSEVPMCACPVQLGYTTCPCSRVTRVSPQGRCMLSFASDLCTPMQQTSMSLRPGEMYWTPTKSRRVTHVSLRSQPLRAADPGVVHRPGRRLVAPGLRPAPYSPSAVPHTPSHTHNFLSQLCKVTQIYSCPQTLHSSQTPLLSHTHPLLLHTPTASCPSHTPRCPMHAAS